LEGCAVYWDRAVFLTIAVSVTVHAAAAPKPVDFNREIRPILSDNCFHCHGPDEANRKVGLRLDTKDGAFAKRGDTAVILPGNSKDSRLVQRITHEKKVLRMPPAYSNLSLTPAQIDVMKRWIDEGAKWETHWAFSAPKKVEPPPVRNAAWSRNPIDRFLYARLEKEGLKPSPPADKSTLLRRVTFDLTGLPPTATELDAFLKDSRPDAYDRAVDRLLASPRYGERMAMQWLDLARYADTHGYHIDSHRDMWAWRDWVIGAFNKNLSFDKFTVYQLAGDLLPGATREQIVATGFNRNHMINYEGGAIPEEYQQEYVNDRVDATSTVWLGLTMGCARCHDHKYDPIRQRDYYRFGAFFNTIPEKGLDGYTGNAAPILPLPTPEQDAYLKELKQTIAARSAELEEDFVLTKQREWEKSRFDRSPVSPTNGLRAWYEFDGNLSDVSGNFRQGKIRKGEPTFSGAPVRNGINFDSSTHAVFPPEALELDKPFTVAFWLRVGRNPGLAILQKMEQPGHGFELALLKPMTLPELKRGHDLGVTLAAGSDRKLALRTSGYRILQGRDHHLVVVSDGSGKAAGIQIFIDGKKEVVTAISDSLASPFGVNAPVEVGNPALGNAFKGKLDDLRFYSRTLDGEEARQLAVDYPVQVVLSSTGKRNEEQKRALRDYYLTNEAPTDVRSAYAELKALMKERHELEERIPTVMVMEDMAKPRDTYLLARGDYQQRKEKVTPGVPSLLPPLPAGAKTDRLALAQWLVSPDHPLTARVTVNRYWQMFFGHGIVKTSEDFGSQGEPPVHVELLDYLASGFVQSGWDVKATMRQIVTSAAYKQSSKVTPALYDKDPENRLLARGPRVRLQAEMIRDNALAVSGLLNAKIGGPSVLPYQPAGLWEELAFGEAYSAQEYVQGHGDDIYRRSMYTFWKRTVPPATLTTFDAPDREKCVSRRPVTNTPLQALATLNDPTFIESARNLATGVLKDSPRGTDDDRLRAAFRRVTARWPSAAELKVLQGGLRAQLQTYKSDPKAAQSLLSIGESKPDPAIEPPVLAAWTNVCTVMLNLDETLTKE
jgi:hypothetical protein